MVNGSSISDRSVGGGYSTLSTPNISPEATSGTEKPPADSEKTRSYAVTSRMRCDRPTASDRRVRAQRRALDRQRRRLHGDHAGGERTVGDHRGQRQRLAGRRRAGTDGARARARPAWRRRCRSAPPRAPRATGGATARTPPASPPPATAAAAWACAAALPFAGLCARLAARVFFCARSAIHLRRRRPRRPNHRSCSCRDRGSASSRRTPWSRSA